MNVVFAVAAVHSGGQLHDGTFYWKTGERIHDRRTAVGQNNASLIATDPATLQHSVTVDLGAGSSFALCIQSNYLCLTIATCLITIVPRVVHTTQHQHQHQLVVQRPVPTSSIFTYRHTTSQIHTTNKKKNIQTKKSNQPSRRTNIMKEFLFFCFDLLLVKFVLQFDLKCSTRYRKKKTLYLRA